MSLKDDGTIEIQDEGPVEETPVTAGETAGEGQVQEAAAPEGGEAPEPAAPTFEVEQPEPLYDATYVRRLEKNLEEMEARLQQTYAAHRVREQEVQRVRERLERDREKRIFQEKARLFEKLLEPLDNLERCLQAAELSGDLQALLEGVALVYKAMRGTFEAQGLERFGAPGERFDPEVHEAISVAPVESEAEHDRIHTVYLPGYRMGDSLIRAARVIVGKAR
jgi:molecular chaperone GrpE